MRDTNTYADPADYADAHAHSKPNCYSNGNTSDYAHAYD
jgi:hypothetical protein